MARAYGDVLWWGSALLLVPIPVSLLYDPWDAVLLGQPLPRLVPVFALSSAAVATVALAILAATRSYQDHDLAETSAYSTIAGAWLAATFAGMLPLLAVLDPVDAWFESMSGLTSTGATVLVGLDATAPSILFYRSLLQFVAGFAFLVVSLGLISRLTHAGAHLLASDEGTSSTWLRANLHEAARAIWRAYALVGGAAMMAYLLAMRLHAGLGWKAAAFDALVHAGSTISAGGFSSHDANLAFYESWVVETVAVAFMLVAGTSFALLYRVRRSPRRLLVDDEWRFFVVVVLVAGILASGLLALAGETVRGAFFTVVSIGTSTGYVTVDHDAWPTLARTLLLVAMLTGAMAGSASGGMKLLRVLLLVRVARREIRKLLHPRAVMPVRHNGRAVPEQTLMTVVAFFFAYISIWMVGAMLLTAIEPRMGIFEGAGAAAAAIGNTGPAVGVVGPFDGHGHLHVASKVLLALLMWIGRLEVFCVLLFLTGRWSR